jgi:hypothetical protein
MPTGDLEVMIWNFSSGFQLSVIYPISVQLTLRLAIRNVLIE